MGAPTQRGQAAVELLGFCLLLLVFLLIVQSYAEQALRKEFHNTFEWSEQRSRR